MNTTIKTRISILVAVLLFSTYMSQLACEEYNSQRILCDAEDGIFVLDEYGTLLQSCTGLSWVYKLRI